MDRSGFQGLPLSLPGCPASSKMLILNAQISHQYSGVADLCSIFLNCIKWCHLGSWSMIDAPCMVAVTTSSPGSWVMIDAPCMVAVVTSSPSRCLQPFNSAWGQRGNKVLQGRKIRSVVVWVSGCFEFPILKGDIRFLGCSGRCLVPLWWMFPQSRRGQYRKLRVYHQEGKTHCDSMQWAWLFKCHPVYLSNRYLTDVDSAEHISRDGVLPANKLEPQS